jgi:hypothetical protein
MGIFHDLAVAARRFADVRRSSDRDHAADDDIRLAEEGTRLLQKLPEDFPAKAVLIDLSADVAPWFTTPLEVEEGQEVTWLAAGRTWMSKPLDVWVGPSYQLWARVGGAGPMANGTRSTHTFRAPRAGALELASYFPGEWKDEDGALATDPSAWRGTRGNMTVLAIAWDGDAERGLRALRELGDPARLVTAELDRLRTRTAPPDGWDYLWFVGQAEIYAATERAARPAIRCRTSGDVGILRRRVDLRLDDIRAFRWNWRVDRLPSALPEDTVVSHDYLSIAVEFENGKDITYFWSAALPSETAFWCPLPAWKEREFHVAVRSGPIGLGAWQSESRDLVADARRWLGGDPGPVVAVWLIANSMMQRRLGEAQYSDVVFETGGGPVRVL